jgi:hypothetical protein
MGPSNRRTIQSRTAVFLCNNVNCQGDGGGEQQRNLQINITVILMSRIFRLHLQI